MVGGIVTMSGRILILHSYSAHTIRIVRGHQSNAGPCAAEKWLVPVSFGGRCLQGFGRLWKVLVGFQ